MGLRGKLGHEGNNLGSALVWPVQPLIVASPLPAVAFRAAQVAAFWATSWSLTRSLPISLKSIWTSSLTMSQVHTTSYIHCSSWNGSRVESFVDHRFICSIDFADSLFGISNQEFAHECAEAAFRI